MAKYTKTELIDDLLLHEIFADVSKKATTEFVNDLLDSIANKVAAGDDVSLYGFGKFEKYAKTKDGKPTGEFTPKFRPAKAFKDKVAA